ncbi:flagellar hook-length control protein FliK [Oxalobacteraceae bacterium OTU3REALA1]|nr:flagellar hook-length control protein FliK [Oxalobacteraceae bacterium OTU3REALA1]
MSITMNRVNHADQAAQAAKTDFTAPVAANRGQQERAGNTAAPARQPAHRTAAAANAQTNQAAPAKSPAAPAPAKHTQSGAGAQAAKGTQPAKTAPAAEHADEASADTPMVAPFAHMLHLVDLPAAGKEDNAPAPVADAAGNANTANTAAGTDALPAMITSMLNTGAAPGGTLALAADARGETVSAVSTLSNSATRLNLAAASVAVNVVAPQPAADAAAARAAAQLQAATAATAQVVSTPAGAAVQGAVAQQAKADAPAADGTVPGPVLATDAAVPQTANAATPAPRALPRGAEAAAGQPADAGATPPATATVAKDENRATVAAPAATTASAGLTAGAPAAPAAPGATVKLAGTPEQWQQPLRQALGDRLQLNLQRNNDHAVIRLEPPNMGSIEISIRHSAGALQVNLSANNSEVLRQLNAIGDSVRQDLSTRQFSDVAVTVSSSRAQSQAQADSGGRNGQQREQDDARTPGRALSEDGAASLFAMTSEQE